MSEASFNAGIVGAFAAVGIACLIAWIVREVRKGPGNRRTGLPRPRPDERSSIEQFKRMHNV